MSIVTLFRTRSKPADRFEQLISPHIDALYHFAYRLTRNSDDAEEVIQLLLTRMYPKLDIIEDIESLKPWLLRSLYNLYVDEYRRRQRQQAVISPEDIPETARSEDHTPQDSADLSLQQSIVMQAIMQLNEDQRVVILLHDAEGYTLDEVSNILQTPLGTLKSRLHRGRNRVKELTRMELSECQQRDTSEEAIND